MQTDEQIEMRLASEVPGHILPGLKRYIEDHIPTGSFLEALISNDLKETFSQADQESSQGVLGIVTYLYNCAPSNCWGSQEAYKAWVEQGGDN